MIPTKITNALAIVILCAMTAAAQNGQRGAQAPDTRPFDSHDLSGIWQGNQYVFNARTEPTFTAEGKRRFDANKPSYGPRAVPPAIGNDYVGACNALGLIRLLLYDPSPIEIIQIPNRVLMHFEWTWDRREVWTDSRKLPNVDDYLPRFNGYSVGKWDGDTFIVDTVGMDDRTWVDHFGYPLSEQARLQERWHRTSYGTLELRITLTDPLLYAMPWESAPVTFRMLQQKDSTLGGWYGLLEDRCVPLEEVDQYNKKVRNPAAGVK
jgi:hypothetical protein